MQIQVNTDDNVAGRESLARRVETEVARTLGRFGEYVTRVEVHLSDEDSVKSSGNDKRCLMEARLAGRAPIAVTDHAGTLDEAYRGAAEKLKRALESTIGRLKDHKGRDSIRGADLGAASQPEEPLAPPREET